MKKLKKYSLSEDELIDVVIFIKVLRNHYLIDLMDDSKPEFYKDSMQGNIHEINKLFDKFNYKFKTNF
jgi:hypothetical protein